MQWARDWQRSEGWDHRLRVLMDYDQTKIEEHRRKYPLETLARLWKSYVSEDAYEETSTGLGGMGSSIGSMYPGPRP